MKFVSFEDTTGIYETVFFPKVYHRFCHILNDMRPYILKGKVEEDFSAITLTVHWIDFLDRDKEPSRNITETGDPRRISTWLSKKAVPQPNVAIKVQGKRRITVL
jgi:DNA polymerase III alpha subunit